MADNLSELHLNAADLRLGEIIDAGGRHVIIDGTIPKGVKASFKNGPVTVYGDVAGHLSVTDGKLTVMREVLSQGAVTVTNGSAVLGGAVHEGAAVSVMNGNLNLTDNIVGGAVFFVTGGNIALDGDVAPGASFEAKKDLTGTGGNVFFREVTAMPAPQDRSYDPANRPIISVEADGHVQVADRIMARCEIQAKETFSTDSHVLSQCNIKASEVYITPQRGEMYGTNIEARHINIMGTDVAGCELKATEFNVQHGHIKRSKIISQNPQNDRALLYKVAVSETTIDAGDKHFVVENGYENALHIHQHRGPLSKAPDNMHAQTQMDRFLRNGPRAYKQSGDIAKWEQAPQQSAPENPSAPQTPQPATSATPTPVSGKSENSSHQTIIVGNKNDTGARIVEGMIYSMIGGGSTASRYPSDHLPHSFCGPMFDEPVSAARPFYAWDAWRIEDALAKTFKKLPLHMNPLDPEESYTVHHSATKGIVVNFHHNQHLDRAHVFGCHASLIVTHDTISLKGELTPTVLAAWVDIQKTIGVNPKGQYMDFSDPRLGNAVWLAYQKAGIPLDPMSPFKPSEETLKAYQDWRRDPANAIDVALADTYREKARLLPEPAVIRPAAAVVSARPLPQRSASTAYAPSIPYGRN